MGCGKARFDRKGKKTPKIENFGLNVVSWDLEAGRTWDLEATCDETLQQPAQALRQAAIGPWGNLHGDF